MAAKGVRHSHQKVYKKVDPFSVAENRKYIYMPDDEKFIRFPVSKRDRFPYQNVVLIALIF